jgi:hypothetical protein
VGLGLVQNFRLAPLMVEDRLTNINMALSISGRAFLNNFDEHLKCSGVEYSGINLHNEFPTEVVEVSNLLAL